MIQNKTHQIKFFKKSVTFRKNISSLIDMYFKSLKEEGCTFSKEINENTAYQHLWDATK